MKSTDLPHFEQRPRLISIDYLHVPDYQRKPSSSRVKQLSKDFIPDAAERIVVNFRDNAYQIIDGQHRYLAAKAQQGIFEMRCDVIEPSVSYEEEAFLFNLYNGESKPTNALQKFVTRYAENEQLAHDIADTVASVEGLKIDLNDDRQPGHIWRVNALQTIYTNYGPRRLVQVLNLLKEGFGLDINTSDITNPLYMGLTRFLTVLEMEKYPLNKEILIKGMQESGPAKFKEEVIKARAPYTTDKATIGAAVTKYLELYNRQLQQMGVASVNRPKVPLKFTLIGNDKQFAEEVYKAEQLKAHKTNELD